MAAIAIPLAADSPWPKDPVVISTPGIFFISGCPCNFLFIFLKSFNFSSSKNPLLAKQLYNAGEQCPFDNTNLSLSSQLGFFSSIFNMLKYNTVKISATDKAPPGCPDCASYTSSIIPLLTFFAIFSNSSILFNFFKKTTLLSISKRDRSKPSQFMSPLRPNNEKTLTCPPV